MVKNSHTQFELDGNAEGTRQLRREADLLLQRLIAGHQQCERRAAETGRHDAIKCITGRSALENAIHTTKAMIHDMDAMLDDLNNEIETAPSDSRCAMPVGAGSDQ